MKQLKHVVCLSVEATHNLNLHYRKREQQRQQRQQRQQQQRQQQQQQQDST